MNKGLCSALAALVFSFYGFSALAEVRLAHTLQDSALRAEPNASAANVGQVGKQTQVGVLERQGGWYQVQTSSGQRGWLPLLSLRFAKDTQASRSNDLGSLLKLGNQASPASGVATGIRGISDEELRSGSANTSASVQSLDAFAASPSEARSFAQQGGLRSQNLPYAR
ncbi:SH3 domain-containing protein [Pseudomonas sp. EA_35y_Pfl2_R111]|uniref:SH3 domain-containing protein n=1 Tax=Pseudomonas sp. EA_35y_Pfl2_R111 TaxID=3088689 RepID=UPI0030D99051